LINDIIDVSKLEAGKTEAHISEFDLEELVNESVDMLRPNLIEKNLEMIVDVPKNSIDH